MSDEKSNMIEEAFTDEAPAKPSLPSLARDYVAKMKRKRELDAELLVVTTDLAKLVGPIVEQMIDAGCQNINIDGMCVYLRGKVECGPAEGVTRDDFVAALEAAGMKNCIGYQWQTLVAELTRMEEEGIPFPEQLNGKLFFDNRAYGLGARKS